MELNNLRLEYVGYPNNTGGRIWIGGIEIADVYQRGGNPDLFGADPIYYEVYIKPFEKFQKVNEWLTMKERNDYIKKCNSVEECVEWVKSKLYEV